MEEIKPKKISFGVYSCLLPALTLEMFGVVWISKGSLGKLQGAFEKFF
jgi:hypothetical protein